MEEETKKIGNVQKVVELGLQQRVFEAMKEPSFSVNKLANQLQSEGINITPLSIRKFVNTSKEAQKEIIAKDMHVANEYKKLTLDYAKAIKDILKEVEEVKDLAKTEKDYATYNQLVGRLMQGIELIAKLTGDIKPAQHVDIKIIYNEITNDVTKRMNSLRKDLFEKTVLDVDAEVIESDKKQVEKLNK